jgi:hypothetical protein
LPTSDPREALPKNSTLQTWATTTARATKASERGNGLLYNVGPSTTILSSVGEFHSQKELIEALVLGLLQVS